MARSMHLFDGRRARISDLLANELLAPGDRLLLHRPQLDERYDAEVTAAGRLRLGDGVDYPNPSAAAGAATGTSIDGWVHWELGDGRSLADLRAELLELDSPTNEPGIFDDEATERHEFLEKAKKASIEGAPVRTPVRHLIELWGQKGRGSRVRASIRAGLANYGLETNPDFAAVPLDFEVEIRAANAEEETTVAIVDSDNAETATEVPLAGRSVDDDFEDPGLKIGALRSSLQPLATVEINDSLDKAITAMQINDYSQLAVLQDKRTLRGAVTWESIVTAWHSGRPNKVLDALKPAQVFDHDDDLLSALPAIDKDGFVFVRSPDRQIDRIFTASDLVVEYEKRAAPFFVVGEIDQLLRFTIQQLTLSIDQLNASVLGNDHAVDEYSSMSFGHYKQVLGNDEVWADLGWRLDRQMVGTELEATRLLRNELAHFNNPDGVDADQLDRLRKFARLIRQYANL